MARVPDRVDMHPQQTFITAILTFFNFRLVFCSMAYMFTTTATVFTVEPLPVLHSRSRPRVPIDFYVV